MKFQSRNRCLPKPDMQSWKNEDFCSVFTFFLSSRSGWCYSLLARWSWVVAGGWRGVLALHASSVSVFIWYPTSTHSRDKRMNTKMRKNESERLDRCVYFILDWIYSGYKKMWNRPKGGKKKGEIKNRHAQTACRMSKQKCLNDLQGERERRI